MENRRLKLLLITHFSTEEVRKHLRLDKKRRLYFLVNRLLGRRFLNHSFQYEDVTPWVPLTIEQLEKRDDIELYVISAHVGMKSAWQHFVLGKVHYYFFNTDFSLFLQRILSDGLWSSLEPNRLIVKRLVSKIKPDIINLIGSDGAYYSNTILGIKDIPVFVSLQTIYSNPSRKKYSEVSSKNWYVEQAIFSKERYYGCVGKMHYDLLKMYCPDAFAFKFSFPDTPILSVPEVEKRYDFVSFAQECSEKKGTYDALSALALVKQDHPFVTLNICGKRSVAAQEKMDELIARYNLEANVVFTDFFERQQDLFRHLKESRFAVLPIKLDVVPGTVYQAMSLGLPVVTNRTSGTPELNRDEQRVLLSEIDDVPGLAENMLRLMKDEFLARQLVENARAYMHTYNDPARKVNGLVEDLYAVFSHYYKGESIPENLIFKA